MNKKYIVINTDSDYKKFKKNLKYYKSLFYINTQFQIENNLNSKDLSLLCNVLNIKSRKKRIEYIYNQACNIIDNSTKGINICGFKNNKCYVQRKKNNNKCNGCCRWCLHQTLNGCSTKNLTCKLFNCTEVKKRFKMLTYKDIDILKLLSIKNRLLIKHDYFSSREEVLKDLYSISLIYSVLRMFYRLVITFIMLSKRCIFENHKLEKMNK